MQPIGKLYVDPALPAWLPDVTLSNLTLGKEKFVIRFWRDGDDTRHEIVEGDSAAVTRRPFFHPCR